MSVGLKLRLSLSVISTYQAQSLDLHWFTDYIDLFISSKKLLV